MRKANKTWEKRENAWEKPLRKVPRAVFYTILYSCILLYVIICYSVYIYIYERWAKLMNPAGERYFGGMTQGLAYDFTALFLYLLMFPSLSSACVDLFAHRSYTSSHRDSIPKIRWAVDLRDSIWGHLLGHLAWFCQLLRWPTSPLA